MGKISKVLYQHIDEESLLPTGLMAFYNDLSHMVGTDKDFTEKYMEVQEEALTLHQKLIANALKKENISGRVKPETAVIASSTVMSNPVFVVEYE